MHQDDPDLDQRLTRFEARLDRFSLALHQWQSQEQSQPAPSRDVDQRIKTLEETLDREAQALRRLHEEPLQQLHAQAANLREICAAAANSVSGFDQIESRLSALQADVEHHLGDLTRTLQTFVTDLRTSSLAPQAPTATWPLERVVHLHDELRRGSNGHDAGGFEPAAGDQHAAVQPQSASPDAAGSRSGRLQLLERSTIEEGQPSSDVAAGFPPRRLWYFVGAGAVAALLIFGAVRIESRLNEAASRAAAAERQAEAVTEAANREAVVAREEANRQIVEARESAQRAETIGAVLTAPDLIRFNLASVDGIDRSSAQLLWSRTRGLVLSASRLPSAPPQAIYQLWLKTNVESVNAGLFTPDATGRATLVTDAPPKIVGPVVGVEVTIEPSGGRSTPSGPRLLVRLPPQG